MEKADEKTEGACGEVPGAFRRLRLATGDKGLDALVRSRVVVVGLGAVGSFATEALARSGVGHLRLVDFDVIKPSNINRQIFALASTTGRLKTEVAAERVHDIFPGCSVDIRNDFFSSETAAAILDDPSTEKVDFVVDAIDSLLSKVNLIVECRQRGIPVVSAMGAADRMDPTKIHVTDISQSHDCPLARQVRKRLHRRGVFDNVTAVWSSEPPCHDRMQEPDEDEPTTRGRERRPLPSMAPVPGIFGLCAANVAITGILEKSRVG